MYYDYFGLNQPPFRITPDTTLFFPGGDRGAILNAMIYAIASGEGIVKVVGEVGSGKTMLCRMLAVELPKSVDVVYLANPNLSPEDILRAIAFELKLAVSANDDRLRVMQSLQQYLLKRHAENRQVVVFVEEAQGMPLATLEEIRILSNLETRQHKLLQIVLFGQPELDQMIAKREIRQLKERITYSFYLKPLKTDEIRDYLNTRMRACGYRGNDIFNIPAIREIGRYSRGLLRRINILADKALLATYAANQHKVTARHVRLAARDSEFVAGWQHAWRAIMYSGLAALLLLGLWIIPYQQFFVAVEQVVENKNVPEAPVIETEPLPTPIATDTGNVNTSVSTQFHSESTIYQPQHQAGLDIPGHVQEPLPPLTDGNPEIFEPEAAIKPTQMDSNPVVMPEQPNQDNADVAEQKSVMETAPQNMAESLLEQQSYAQFVNPEGDSVTGEEAELLLWQLKLIPPEMGNFAGTDTECRLCTSIIYRPLVKPKSL